MDQNHWKDVLVDTVNALSNITYNMGLFDEPEFLNIVAKNLDAMLTLHQLNENADAPILRLMKKLLEAGQRSGDQDTWHTQCLKKPWLQVRTYQVTQDLQIQLLKAHHAGWLYYECLHLMLEQRDYWCSSDILWLLVMASEYIDEHWIPEKVEATITFDNGGSVTFLKEETPCGYDCDRCTNTFTGILYQDPPFLCPDCKAKEELTNGASEPDVQTDPVVA